MDEGKIIHHDFGKQPEDKPKPGGMEIVLGLAGLLSGEKSNIQLEKFTATMKKLREMRVFLESLQSISTTETAVLRQELVSELTFEEACDIILNSSEQDWQTKPSYYKAVSDWFSPENLAKVLQENLRK